MKTRTLEITRYFTNDEYMTAMNVMREKGIVKGSFYLDIYDTSLGFYYNPQRFYWDATNPKAHVMIYGPIHHNDNHL